MHGKDKVDDLRNAKSFEDLTSAQIGILLSAYRMIPIQDSKKNVFELITEKEIGDYFPEIKNYHMVNDAKMVHLMGTWDKLRLQDERAAALKEDLHPTALAEYLGKSLAYIRLETGMVVPVPNAKNEIQYFKVVAHSKLMGDGVLFYLLAPMNSKQDAYQNPEEHHIHLLWRGTNCNPGTLEAEPSLRRDFSWGIGNGTFEYRKPEMLSMLEEYLKDEQEKKVVLNITGHSLGGVDTQRALATITEKRSDYSAEHVFGKITCIKAVTHNSPYASPSYCQRFADAIERIGSKIADEADDFEIFINHVRFSSKYKDGFIEDFIQKYFGDILMGGEQGGKEVIVKADFVHRKMTDIKLHKEFEPLDRHGVRVFNEAKYQDGWSLSVSTPDNDTSFEEKLSGRYHWTEEGKNQVSIFLGKSIWTATSGFRAIGRAFRIALDAIAISPKLSQKQPQTAQ